MDIKKISEAKLPTDFGEFKIIVYGTEDNQEHVALVHGNIAGKKEVLVRVHSECLTGDTFHSRKCDCGKQLISAMKKISKEDGVIVYLKQEGRGIGLGNKIKAYQLQDQGYDTVEANEKLGFRADPRDYTIGAKILQDLGLTTIRIITNNPKKIIGLKKFGIKIVERVHIPTKHTKENEKYFKTKKEKLGHLFEKGGFIKDSR